MKKLMFLFYLIFSVTVVFSQQTAITGTVTESETGEPIPGASIIIQGTTSGTITDFDGNYTIQAAGDDVLVFSFVGLASQEVAVNNRTTINVQLEQSTELVDEVVVVGYGQLKVKDLTSSISTVNSEEIAKSPSGQAMQTLQGKVAGMQV
ncbi:carboxypeptidase-like regulatory domain-containing protein, partial [uncultured Sunxiuqinia sp.]|uniref:carboxypeptidase-like regulatory domain-containing protein n=1 Tax=uncultured Sunxiuqinia sp. TaxID=1573825 RepID=UPI0030DB9E71